MIRESRVYTHIHCTVKLFPVCISSHFLSFLNEKVVPDKNREMKLGPSTISLPPPKKEIKYIYSAQHADKQYNYFYGVVFLSIEFHDEQGLW